MHRARRTAVRYVRWEANYNGLRFASVQLWTGDELNGRQCVPRRTRLRLSGISSVCFLLSDRVVETGEFDRHTEACHRSLNYFCSARKCRYGKGDGLCMLAKCANPSCCASFRNLQEGRLFRLEADRESTPSANSDASRQSRVEYFWLCGPRSKSMALGFGQDGTVVTVSLPNNAHRNPEDFPIISRRKHTLLRSVTFARKRGEGRSEPRSARNLRS